MRVAHHALIGGIVELLLIVARLDDLCHHLLLQQGVVADACDHLVVLMDGLENG